jgi:hypothetical protein
MAVLLDFIFEAWSIIEQETGVKSVSTRTPSMIRNEWRSIQARQEACFHEAG